jgi:hypothetical protein
MEQSINKQGELSMKRYTVVVVIFVMVLAAVQGQGQNINKSRYQEISLAEYVAAGNVKERTDTELFKMEFKFVLQAANSVAVQDAEGALHRFESEKKLDFQRGAEIVLYISSTHAEDGYWETERINLAEPKTSP